MFEVLCALPLTILLILGILWLVYKIQVYRIDEENSALYSRIQDYILKHRKPRALTSYAPRDNAFKRQLRWNDSLKQNRETLEQGLEKYLKDFAEHQKN